MHIKLDHIRGNLVVVFTLLPALRVHVYSLVCDILCGNCLYIQNSHIVNRYILPYIVMINLEVLMQNLLISQIF